MTTDKITKAIDCSYEKKFDQNFHSKFHYNKTFYAQYSLHLSVIYKYHCKIEWKNLI